MSYGRRRKSMATRMRESREAYWRTPQGSFEYARREMVSKNALGYLAANDVRWWADEARRIGREAGFDISSIDNFMEWYEANTVKGRR
jgi:hypothetical protein